MFSLKAALTSSPIEKVEVTFERLSIYDLNVGLNYSIPQDKKDFITIRYEGVDGKSLFEISLIDGLIAGLSLICFEGVTEVYDSYWTRPQRVNENIFGYRLFMDDKNCAIRVAPHEIDQRKDVRFLIYTDAVIFLTGTADVYSTNKISEELYILLAENGLVLGYSIISKEDVNRFKDIY